jgi:hypothetical protein
VVLFEAYLAALLAAVAAKFVDALVGSWVDDEGHNYEKKRF